LMGDPKKKHKLYTTPKRPYDVRAFEEDLKILGVYGLRNKRELWRARTELSTLRRRAREMLSFDPVERIEMERILIRKLYGLGLVPESSSLDNTLSLSVGDLLERRLQTVVYRTGMAKTLFQSRQLITHGHISIDGRKVKSPSYRVTREDEAKLAYAGSSPVSLKDHPLRQEIGMEELKGGAPVE